jgi:FkbM family methyltransferase
VGIVSYAQNFEDVMLWRALGAEGPGFWIDVGASDPTVHSVTRAFAERGWRGINVEPLAAEFEALRQYRPNDINLCLALAARPGEMTFYDCEDGGLSSLDPASAERNRAAGRRVEARAVEVSTLAEICARHAPPDIHFLKIDVEGAERQVLEGADFATWRPWIVVVEATIPMSQTDASAEWETLLTGTGYRFCYFDGLNRFYLAEERWAALGRHFAAPPNVFDGFTLADSQTIAIEARLRRAEAELAVLRTAPALMMPSIAVPGLALRTARWLRRFFSAELRAEITLLRQDMEILVQQMDQLRRQLRS